MEVQLEATFTDRLTMEKTAEILRSQGVLDIKFNYGGDAQAVDLGGSLVQSVESYAAAEPAYALTVSVEKSRYRQAEDTIVKYGGQLH
ncbi:hypothetical protein ACFPES_27555 [Paenibacillus sp. GCM10023248]|uniref:hypothetical protein n=1 Tax=Bacillales TaxID=1385 RepID=UPI0023797D13|nr:MULTISPECIES: hypothetical protein [Bacillales]MDD9270820.1 hypothetical protein [Paenibacillus sp. MAHUQ-63]MDR6883269.1 hypothetical protein [Bacillus sp. 3255]